MFLSHCRIALHFVDLLLAEINQEKCTNRHDNEEELCASFTHAAHHFNRTKCEIEKWSAIQKYRTATEEKARRNETSKIIDRSNELNERLNRRRGVEQKTNAAATSYNKINFLYKQLNDTREKKEIKIQQHDLCGLTNFLHIARPHQRTKNKSKCPSASETVDEHKIKRAKIKRKKMKENKTTAFYVNLVNFSLFYYAS